MRERALTAFCLGFLTLGLATAGAQTGPTLVLDAGQPTSPGTPVAVPLGFANQGHAISALVFSFDLDPAGLAFDPTDADGDGIPDSVTLPAGMPSIAVVVYDATDLDGELDVLLANLSGAPLAEGVILELELTAHHNGSAASWIGFSDDPPPSFGNAQGQNVEGTAVVLGPALVFADGFESGDTSAWRTFSNPRR